MRTPRIPRPRLSYANVAATLALVIAASMGGAYAHGKIGSALIKNNAVKSRHIGFQQVKTGDLGKKSVSTNRIKAKAVSRSKLKPNARPTTITYQLGAHDFGSANSVCAFIPGDPSYAVVKQSVWSATVHEPTFLDPIIVADTPNYQVTLWRSPFAYDGKLVGCVDDYENRAVNAIDVVLTRTLRTSNVTPVVARKLSPRQLKQLEPAG